MNGNCGVHRSRELHMAVRIQYVCDFIIKLCRQHVQVVPNHEDESVCIFAQGKTHLAALKHTTTQMTTLLLNGK